jgi:hypothetical protein
MKLNKVQEQTYQDLLQILRQQGRERTFGWALGMLINLSQHDPDLRRRIKNKIKQ